MEDGVKGDTAKPKEVKFLGKAGWVKKSTGKFLGLYKDRYVQVERTEIVVYESEDLKNCLERVDLENYDKCHELKGAFKKKNSLILVRAPKCGNKINDVKIQAQNTEDKEDWIKAFSDGINRAKNKIFDEVTVDESCSLEHVTRTRAKGNQGRRPPTRMHMKEVGILRRDLDAVDNTPNGTHQVNTEADASKAVKPPMPPSMPSESPQETPEEGPTPQKKVLKPPMPPSKENKSGTPGEEEALKEVVPTKASDSSEETDSTRITPPPSPAPPSRDPVHPPMPPSKDKKPAQTIEWEVPPPSCDSKDSQEESPEEMLSDGLAKNDSDELGSEADSTHPPQKKAFKAPEAKLGSTVPEEPDEASAEKEGSCPALTAPEKDEPDNCNVSLEGEGNPASAIASAADTQRPAAPVAKSTEPSPQPAKKNPGPPAPRKKKTHNRSEANQTCDLKEGSDEVATSAQSKGSRLPNDPMATVEPKNEMAAPSTADAADVTVFPDHAEQKRKREESSNSSQRPDDEPQGGDGKGASASVVGGGRERGQDAGSEAEAEPAEGHMSQRGEVVPGERGRVLMLQQVQTNRRMQPTLPALPLKPSKLKSASVGDLLSESMEQRGAWPVEEISRTSPGNDMIELRKKVALELEDTVELLEREMEGSVDEKGGQESLLPEELLTKAVEKLRKADQFLREAKSLKQADSLEKKRRLSW
ncbi:hypothetical protein SKAU_G00349740 [Synaphobranchus kaupii]|uniref:PH domain-containing protein n=1 Tax=Synaphobranchus kaupii TaxID=118154 RepID=A0A9Q1EK91_SYNKA|nr:hypothetical protein SKAU_G00349740 [Synaphobranchus kaupii]